MGWIVPDFETASACNLKTAGSWRYAEDPSTDVLCLLWECQDGTLGEWYPGDPPPEDLFKRIREGASMVAHGSSFEEAIWTRIMVPLWGWPPVAEWWDTQAVCAMRVLPLGLDRVLKVLRLPQAKDMEGNKLTLSLSKFDKRGMLPQRTPAIIQRVGQYCRIDVESQVALHRRLGWLPEGEGAVFQQVSRMNRRGIALDLPLVHAMKRIVDQAKEPLLGEFADLTGGLMPTQSVKLRSWVNDAGVPCDSLDKEHMADMLGGDVDESPDDFDSPGYDLPPPVRRMLEIKQLVGSSSIAKLDTMLNCVCSDGRARGLTQYHGTGPGRNTGRLIQPHNFPKGIIKGGDGEAPSWEALVPILMSGDAGLVEAVFGAPVHVVLSSLRHCLVASPGRVYLAGDYSGIQARLVLSLAGQHDKTALMAKGFDPYIDNALSTFPDLPRVDLGDKDAVKKWKLLYPWARGVGKNSVLGLGFQMGWFTYQFKYAKDRDQDYCEGIVNAYRKVWAPEVPKLWAALQTAALYAVHDKRVTEAYGLEFRMIDEWLTMRLPSGRLLWYFNPQPCRKHMPWSTEEKPDIRDAWTYQVTKAGRWITVDAHGGKTTENAVMGMERDLMTDSQRKLEAEGFPMILEVHDENVTEPKDNADLNAFKQIMEDVPEWCRALGTPVQVDVWADYRYKK